MQKMTLDPIVAGIGDEVAATAGRGSAAGDGPFDIPAGYKR